MQKTIHKKYWVQFAGLSCHVSSSDEWKKYFIKIFDSSNVHVTDATLSPKKPWMNLYIHDLKKASYTSGITIHDKGMKMHVTTGGTPYFLYPLMVHVIQRVYTILFYYHGGFVLHASAVESQKKAHIFVGVSGQGKTTIAGLSYTLYRKRILADNQVFIRKIADKYMVFPFPFDPFHKDAPPYLPIDAIYLLKKSDTHNIEPLSFRDKINAYKNEIQLQVPIDVPIITNYHNILFDFVRMVIMKRLSFAKKKGFWEVIHAIK